MSARIRARAVRTLARMGARARVRPEHLSELLSELLSDRRPSLAAQVTVFSDVWTVTEPPGPGPWGTCCLPFAAVVPPRQWAVILILALLAIRVNCHSQGRSS